MAFLTVVHRLRSVATKQFRSESGGLKDLGHDAGVRLVYPTTILDVVDMKWRLHQHVFDEAIGQWCRQLRPCETANRRPYKHFLRYSELLGHPTGMSECFNKR